MTTRIPDPSTARGHLVVADAHAAHTRRDGAWYVGYAVAFGLGFGLLTLVLGLGPGGVAWLLGTIVGWGAFTAVMVVWSSRRPVQRRLPREATGAWLLGWIGTPGLYSVALTTGLLADPPAWLWVPAAVAVAVPMLAAAALLHRRLA